MKKNSPYKSCKVTTWTSIQMDNGVLTSIHSHLSRQQDGISHLLDIIRDDLQHLDIIKQGLADKVVS